MRASREKHGIMPNFETKVAILNAVKTIKSDITL